LRAQNPWCYGSAHPAQKKVSHWPATRKSPSGSFLNGILFSLLLSVFSLVTAISTTYQTCPFFNRFLLLQSKEPCRAFSSIYPFTFVSNWKSQILNHISYFSKFRILVREAGLFIFIEVADLGLVLQWDHGTRIYLRLDPKWKGRVSVSLFMITVIHAFPLLFNIFASFVWVNHFTATSALKRFAACAVISTTMR
jgi:hypothetical protein